MIKNIFSVSIEKELKKDFERGLFFACNLTTKK